MEDRKPIIEIKNVHKTFGDHKVLNGMNVVVHKGEDVVILGRSGSGKSVTIKCVVGLEHPDKGSIKVFGTEITTLTNKELNEIRPRIGFMFQNGALYDSMSVRQNLAFTLKHHDRNITDEVMEQKITEALDNVGLLDALDKMPAELSGGMRKRIGMARTLIVNPEIILYDEPTSGLDTITAREISELMVAIQKKNKTTSLIITHDLACAKITGDRIIVLQDGVISAEGTYAELENSKDPSVHSFFI
ncbi:ABC transporter ATP-binding protein [Flavobacterium sp.]|uniref:ABC transporter ATP-binding protein n=1 Tax=Flavobacterium sp. TaxID=239 RepID=UPI0025EC0BB5|nr:ATP-binding cassette domain-containing protein [Flavobacterium sp.]